MGTEKFLGIRWDDDGKMFYFTSWLLNEGVLEKIMEYVFRDGFVEEISHEEMKLVLRHEEMKFAQKKKTIEQARPCDETEFNKSEIEEKAPEQGVTCLEPENAENQGVEPENDEEQGFCANFPEVIEEKVNNPWTKVPKEAGVSGQDYWWRSNSDNENGVEVTLDDPNEVKDKTERTRIDQTPLELAEYNKPKNSKGSRARPNLTGHRALKKNFLLGTVGWSETVSG